MFCLAAPVLGIIAIALGVLGRAEIRRAEGRLGGRVAALAGIVMGALSFVVFGGVLALSLPYIRVRLRTHPVIAASPAATASIESLPTPASSSLAPPGVASGDAESTTPATSSITTVGTITIVDVGSGVTSLAKELRDQRTAAASHGEKLLVQTMAPSCAPCDGVATSLGDPRMQKALARVRLVRVDRDQFQEDLEEMQIPVNPYPGFFLLDSDLKITDAINGGEWDDDVPGNIAPVLGPFVRGTYTKRRIPWKRSPQPSGTVL
jgi:hypothetical protein